MRRREALVGILGLAAYSVGAQPVPVIGWLSLGGRPSSATSFADAFRQGLSRMGFVEGQNVVVERRYAGGVNEHLLALAAELVSRKVDVIVAVGGTPPARAAKTATSTLPIVFATGEDPVADGLVASLSRPGGNLTGISILAVELNGKRLDLLRQVAPGANPIALLVNPTHASVEHETRSFRQEAHLKGVEVVIEEARDDSEIETAFASLHRKHVGALAVSSDPYFLARRRHIVDLAARYTLPAIYAWREYALEGGLLAYDPSIDGVARQLGTYAGRILKGAKPPDLPVEQPTTFDLVVNLRAAKALGLAVPPSLLGLAGEVVE